MTYFVSLLIPPVIFWLKSPQVVFSVGDVFHVVVCPGTSRSGGR